MNAKQLSEMLGAVNDEYVSEAETYTAPAKRSKWVPWAAVAACLCLAVFASVFFSRSPEEGPVTPLFAISVYAENGDMTELIEDQGHFLSSVPSEGNGFGVDMPLFSFKVHPAGSPKTKVPTGRYDISVSYIPVNISSAAWKQVDWRDEHVAVSYYLTKDSWGYSVTGWFTEMTDISVTVTDKETGEIVAKKTVFVNYHPEEQRYMLLVHDAYGYYTPNYLTKNTQHTDTFLAILKRDGCYRDGKQYPDFNTERLENVRNVTPQSISDERGDMEVFVANDGFCFLMAGEKIYRFDTFGGYHRQLCLWDYDGNGTKDLVSFASWGSGLPYVGVKILDLTTAETIDVCSTMVLSEPRFSFEFVGGTVFINDAPLTYSGGSFHCAAFQNDAE